jgi:hypothetical protein
VLVNQLGKQLVLLQQPLKLSSGAPLKLPLQQLLTETCMLLCSYLGGPGTTLYTIMVAA